MSNRRFHGVLGSCSLVQISNELMATAKAYEGEHGVHFTHYCLLSGQDYPLQPVSNIVAELRETYPKPYIDCTPWSEDNWAGRGSRNTLWWDKLSLRINEAMAQGGPLRKVVKLPFYLANRIGRVRSNAHGELSRRGIRHYGGSAWWIVTDDMADCLLDERDNLGEDSRFWPLTAVDVPEENWYQTVLMNSGFADDIEVNPPDMVGQNCKTYAHFNPDGRPFTGHPYILTEGDENLLRELARSRFFARKFDDAVGSSVLDWIDSELLGSDEPEKATAPAKARKMG